MLLRSEIYLLTDFNHRQYPDYYKWFYMKIVPRIFNNTGEMIFYLDGFNIVGLAILKKDEVERKICTLLIAEEYRRKGYGKKIVEDAIAFLETSTPLITIPKKRIEEFSNIINAYNWQETNQTNDYYSKEIIFNEFENKIKKK